MKRRSPRGAGWLATIKLHYKRWTLHFYGCFRTKIKVVLLLKIGGIRFIKSGFIVNTSFEVKIFKFVGTTWLLYTMLRVCLTNLCYANKFNTFAIKKYWKTCFHLNFIDLYLMSSIITLRYGNLYVLYL